jgi:hypothetical protein
MTFIGKLGNVVLHLDEAHFGQGREIVRTDALSAPLADSCKEFVYGLYSKVTWPLYRTVGLEPDVQNSVRGPRCRILMPPCGSRFFLSGGQAGIDAFLVVNHSLRLQPGGLFFGFCRAAPC